MFGEDETEDDEINKLVKLLYLLINNEITDFIKNNTKDDSLHAMFRKKLFIEIIVMKKLLLGVLCSRGAIIKGSGAFEEYKRLINEVFGDISNVVSKILDLEHINEAIKKFNDRRE